MAASATTRSTTPFPIRIADPDALVTLNTQTRARMPGTQWKSLEEYESDPEFLARVQKEFAPGAEWWIDQASRREFLKTMGASLALAGLTGCTIRQPVEKIIPYVQIPENMIPGKAQFYATAMPLPGGAIGLLAESHEGRPTKIEGNPDHPTSLGATCTFSQASVLGLYDPHRLQVVHHHNRPAVWSEFTGALEGRLTLAQKNQGAGFALLTEEIISPTLQRQLRAFLQANPQAKWYQYAAWESSNATQAARQVFGAPVTARYHLPNADIIFSVGADFLAEGPSHVRLVREFSARRIVNADATANMNRLYVAETTPSQTGAKADHWLRLKPDDVAAMLIAVAAELGLDVGGEARTAKVKEAHQNWITALAGDLKAARGKSVVIVGAHMPSEIHALAHLVNQELGNIGQTVTLVDPINVVPDQTPGTISDLTQAMEAGQVQSLVILGGDPAFTAPANLKFGEKLKSVPFTAYYALQVDSTAQLVQWRLPATHYLEDWSDARAEDGSVSIIQPLIRPLYDGRSVHELLAILSGQKDVTGFNLVQETWLPGFGNDAKKLWEKALHDGVIANSAFQPATPAVKGEAAAALKQAFAEAPAESKEFTVVFRTDPSLLDGRYATNGWLQELPQPLSKLTWGNAAWIGYSTAKDLGLKSGDHINIQRGDVTVSIPVWIQFGQPSQVITLQMGHGRTVEGFKTVGVDVYPLRSAANEWVTTAQVKPTGKRTVLVTTQPHHNMEGRHLVRSGTLKEFQDKPNKPGFMTVGLHHGGGDEHEGGEHGAAEHGTEGHSAEQGGHAHDAPHGHEAVASKRDVTPHHGHPAVIPEGENQNPHYPEGGPTFYEDWPRVGNQWGMTINLGACTGCNACVVACQSENNIPVVGPEQVIRGREMHWLRIDSYFEGDPDTPDVYHQPVSCMHCEHAPCEPVCPVGATTHSSEGINEMTYNRCIGTRYCSNNCPYKVRRFNFLALNDPVWQLPVLQMAQNPNVTVRSRGVMEKCNYCVQRISAVRIQSKMENREIRDGEIRTACQSACSAGAITFGNVDDPDSAVRKAKEHPLNYGLLTDLNTRPRTSYLAAVRNPNPALVSTAAEDHA